MLTRASTRARGLPDKSGRRAEGDVLLGVGPVEAELGRALEPPGIAVGGPVEQHDRRSGAISTPPTVVARRVRRNRP